MKKTNANKNTNLEVTVNSLNDLTKDFMVNYILENAPEHKAWFKELVSTKVTVRRRNRKGEWQDVQQPQTFAEVRKQFAMKFFPTLIAEKNMTLAEMVANW